MALVEPTIRPSSILFPICHRRLLRVVFVFIPLAHHQPADGRANLASTNSRQFLPPADADEGPALMIVFAVVARNVNVVYRRRRSAIMGDAAACPADRSIV